MLIFYKFISLNLFTQHLCTLTGAVDSITDQDAEGNEPLEGDKDISEVRAEPYSLPEGFKWDTLNLDDPEQVRMSERPVLSAKASMV